MEILFLSLSGGVESQQEVDYLSALCLSPLPIIRTADVDGANAFFFSSFRPYFPMIKRTEKKTKDRKETKKKWKTKKKRNNLSGGGFNGEKKKKVSFFFQVLVLFPNK